jgi:hypothetical protein
LGLPTDRTEERVSEHDKDQANEGEGNRSADRRYREGVKRTVERGDAEELADRARREVEASPEEYRKAEQEGRARSAGDLEDDLEGKH